MQQKTFHISSSFDVKAAGGSKGLRIAGYANTVDKDRVGDIVLATAWEKGVKEYLKNPIILYQHKHDEPIGRAESVTVDKKGLFLDAVISDAASNVQTLIKDGVLKSFSIGFRIKDADYDKEKDTFFIKEVELLEVSVVSVPANQNSLFRVSKEFSSDDEYQEFKKQFVTEEETVTQVPEDEEVVSSEEKTLTVDLTAETVTTNAEVTTDTVVTEAKAADLIINNEGEADTDEDSDPYKPIPFHNLLSVDTSNLTTDHRIKLGGTRYRIDEIAVAGNPFFKFIEIDVQGLDKNPIKELTVHASDVSIVNPWDLTKNFDIVVSLYKEIELTDNSRSSIRKTFNEKVLSNIPELVKIKANGELQVRHQKFINDVLNLKTDSDWTDSHYALAKRYVELVEELQNLNKDINVDFELSLFGYENADAESNKEKKEMTDQVIGEALVVNTGSTSVSEPRVAELIAKTGEAINRQADNQDKHDLNGSRVDESLKEVVAELRAELRQYKDQALAHTTSKMDFQSSREVRVTRKEMADAYFLAKALNRDPRDVKYTREIMEKAVISGSVTASPLQTAFSEDIYHEMQQKLVIAPLFRRIPVNSKSFSIPVSNEDTGDQVAQFASGTYASNQYDSTNRPDAYQSSLSSVELTPHKFMATTHLAKDEEEDSLIPLIDFLRDNASRRLARFLDKVLLRGTGTGTGFSNTASLSVGAAGVASPIKGVAKHANNVLGNGLVTFTGGASNKANAATIASARARMGKYGLALGENLVYLTTIEGYNSLVTTSDFQTVDKFGPQATYLTGSVGAIYGIPIVITEFLDVAGTANNDIGLLMYKPGFVIGERRSIEVESEYKPDLQVTAMYLSTRFDMKPLTTVSGAALSNTYSFASVVRAF